MKKFLNLHSELVVPSRQRSTLTPAARMYPGTCEPTFYWLFIVLIISARSCRLSPQAERFPWRTSLLLKIKEAGCNQTKDCFRLSGKNFLSEPIQRAFQRSNPINETHFISAKRLNLFQWGFSCFSKSSVSHCLYDKYTKITCCHKTTITEFGFLQPRLISLVHSLQ